MPLQTTLGNIPGDYSLFNFQGDALYHFMPEGRLVPYVALGAGMSRTEWLLDNNVDAILDYGGGVKYFINDWLALRGDIRQIFSFHTDRYGATAYWNNFEYTFGLAFQFGGAKPGIPPAAAPQPEAPAPAPAPAPQAPVTPPVTQAPATPPVTREPVTPPVTYTPVTPPVTREPVTAPIVQAPMTAPSTEPLETVRAPKAPAPAPPPEAAPPPKVPQPPPPPTAEGQTSWQAREGAIKVPEGKIALTGMTILPDALEILFTKGFYYEIHVFSKPFRMEIVVRAAVNALDVDAVTVNRLGIATVRLENQQDALKVILHPAAGYALPSRVDVTDNFRGLLIRKALPAGKK